MDSLIDLIFIFDICLNFRTTFINNAGESVTDSYVIGCTYLRSKQFYMDVLSSVPFSELLSIDILKFLGILKV